MLLALAGASSATRSLPPELWALILKFKTRYEIWDDLKWRYGYYLRTTYPYPREIPPTSFYGYENIRYIAIKEFDEFCDTYAGEYFLNSPNLWIRRWFFK